MIFEFLFIISHILLYPYPVGTVQVYLDSTTETFFDCPEFEISDPWNSLTEAEYIEDIVENSCEGTDWCHYEPKQFDVFGIHVDDHISPHYQSGWTTKQCIIVKR